MGVVCSRELTRPGCGLSLCRCTVGFTRSTICSSHRCSFRSSRHDCMLYSAQYEHIHWYVRLLALELPSINNITAGMALAGVGAGINELTALAATSELAPTAKRGKYVAVLIFTILPFCPSVLWAQLIAYHSTWRYIGLFCGLWSFLGLIMTAIFYHPPPRINSTGLTRKEIIAQIDFVGGFLSISGMILFLAGLLWGGYQVSTLSQCPRNCNI